MPHGAKSTGPLGEHGAAACEPCINRFAGAFARLSEQRRLSSARCAALSVETLLAVGEEAPRSDKPRAG